MIQNPPHYHPCCKMHYSKPDFCIPCAFPNRSPSIITSLSTHGPEQNLMYSMGSKSMDFMVTSKTGKIQENSEHDDSEEYEKFSDPHTMLILNSWKAYCRLTDLSGKYRCFPCAGVTL